MTMKDVAAQLGVSRTTVSLVLKGDGDRYRIHPETQKKILRLAKKLDYKPNFFAAALNRRATCQVGVVFPNVFEAFMTEMVKGIEDVLYARGYTMLLSTCRFERKREQTSIEQLVYRGVDGLLLVPNAPMTGEKYNYAHIERLAGDNIPMVFIDRFLPHIGSSYVIQDDFNGARDAVTSLMRLGRTRIAYVSLDIDITSIHRRFEGYTRALGDAGMALRDDFIIKLRTRDPQSTDLSGALSRLMKRPAGDRPDAFFVTTHGLSLRVLRILAAMGLALNHDFSVAKFGADPEHHPTGMLCVRQPHAEMGSRAATLLLDTISAPKSTDAARRHIVLPAVLEPAAVAS